jgi:hypothetical protein
MKASDRGCPPAAPAAGTVGVRAMCVLNCS